MDVQEYIDNALKASRANTLANSPQLTLGELILKLQPIINKQEGVKDDDLPHVVYDFEYLYPTTIDSWRGVYAELALDYSGYRRGDDKDKMRVTEFFVMLKDCLGKTFEGYKGGDFTMNKHTPIWVANYGNAGRTGVIEVLDESYEVILVTGLCEV